MPSARLRRIDENQKREIIRRERDAHESERQEPAEDKKPQQWEGKTKMKSTQFMELIDGTTQ